MWFIDLFYVLVQVHVDTEHVCVCCCFFFVMIRRPPGSTQSRSSAASDVYKRQCQAKTQHPREQQIDQRRLHLEKPRIIEPDRQPAEHQHDDQRRNLHDRKPPRQPPQDQRRQDQERNCLLYTSRAHETVLDLVCRLLLEKNKTKPSPLYDCHASRYHMDFSRGCHVLRICAHTHTPSHYCPFIPLSARSIVSPRAT